MQHEHGFKLSNKETWLAGTILTVYNQQHKLIYGNKDSVSNRIVSIHKPYLRRIVRGKENKPAEFGARLNKVQVDGISFIEHLSFYNFNEGTRLKQSVAFHKKHFGKLHQLGADGIYATNENRRYCT